MSDSGSATPSARASGSGAGAKKDRHEPRGRKPNDHLPPSRAREVQRAFRLRRAEHLAQLEERINALEAENSQLRRLLNIPEADRPKIGTGPTGRGKSLREGGVPMSERVRARREAARARERKAREMGVEGNAADARDAELKSDHELSDEDGAGDQAMGGVGATGERSRSTLSPRASMPPPPPQSQSHLPAATAGSGHDQHTDTSSLLPLFQPPDGSTFDYRLPLPFNAPLTPDNPFADFESAIFKPSTGTTPNFSSIFGLYDDNPAQHLPHTQDHHVHHDPLAHLQNPHHQNHNHSHNSHNHNSPISPPLTTKSTSSAGLNSSNNQPPSTAPPPPMPVVPPGPGPAAQPELLTRLKQCCHLSDSHVVNDPGLLIFATRLCQSFPCSFSGVHPDSLTAISDSDHVLLDDSWRALRNQLDPGTDVDGENRINTGRMAAELVIRAAHSRGQGSWVLCRFREGMSIRRNLIAGLVNGLGGNFE